MILSLSLRSTINVGGRALALGNVGELLRFPTQVPKQGTTPSRVAAIARSEATTSRLMLAVSCDVGRRQV